MDITKINGDWVNGLRSRMTLIVGSNNQITGTYLTAVGRDEGKNKEFPLFGRIHWPLISFIVDYESVDSVTAWVGKVIEPGDPDSDNDKIVIKTIWLMGSSNTGSRNEIRPTRFWEAFNINQDTFTRAS